MRAALAGVKDVVDALRKPSQVLPCWRGLAPQDIKCLAAAACPSLIARSRQAGADPSWVFTKVVLPSPRSTASTMSILANTQACHVLPWLQEPSQQETRILQPSV